MRPFFASLFNGGNWTVDETSVPWKVTRRDIRGLGTGAGALASDTPSESVHEYGLQDAAGCTMSLRSVSHCTGSSWGAVSACPLDNDLCMARALGTSLDIRSPTTVLLQPRRSKPRFARPCGVFAGGARVVWASSRPRDTKLRLIIIKLRGVYTT